MSFCQYRLPILWGVLFCVAVALVGVGIVGKAGHNTQITGVDDEGFAVEEVVTMIAVGDLMLGRTVETLTVRSGDDHYPFARIGDLLKGYDIVFGNLEGTVPDKHVVTPPGSFRFNFREEVVPVLVDEGFTVVSLANNHSLDYGQSGFDQTMAKLDAAGIGHVGHYSEEQYDVYETDVRGRRFVMVAFNMIEPDFDEEAAVEWARTAAERPHDVLLASAHWGAEYVNRPAAVVKRFAEKLIDAGVDVVLGGHPHVVQTIGTYKGKTIIYSMGNFVFDQYWSEPTQLGMVVGLEFVFTENVEPRIGLRPIPIDLHKSQPRVYEDDVRIQNWRKWLVGISDPILKEMILQGEIWQ